MFIKFPEVAIVFKVFFIFFNELARISKILKDLLVDRESFWPLHIPTRYLGTDVEELNTTGRGFRRLPRSGARGRPVL